jgi:hypothetical protein
MNVQSNIAGGGRSSARLKVNPPLGSLPVLQYCAPEQLLIDETYQRSLEVESSQALIRRIAIQWDWGLCQPLFVARRADGGLYVVDGQHRLAAAVLRGDIAQLPCVVSHFDSPEQEAGAFVALNQQRRPLNALDLFKAALAAGDKDALLIKQCVDEAGLSLANGSNNQSMKAGSIANIGGLQRCERIYGAVVLSTSLKVLAAAYPKQVLRCAGWIFPGIVAVVAGELHHRADPAGLVEKLAALIGREPQHHWYRAFAQAIVDDHMLKRAAAAERVIRTSWVEWSQAQFGLHRAEAQDRTGDPAPSCLKPAETAWCEQCDQRVSGAKASACTSPFCRLKAEVEA